MRSCLLTQTIQVDLEVVAGFSWKSEGTKRQQIEWDETRCSHKHNSNKKEFI